MKLTPEQKKLLRALKAVQKRRDQWRVRAKNANEEFAYFRSETEFIRTMCLDARIPSELIYK